jgi:PAS domain-containing protein
MNFKYLLIIFPSRVHDEDELPATLAMWELSFAAGKAFEATMLLRGSDGAFRSFLTKVEPARNQSGQIIRWIGIHTDITAQVEAEAKLRSINYTMQNLTSYRQAVVA